jgi:hypothetical protein
VYALGKVLEEMMRPRPLTNPTKVPVDVASAPENPALEQIRFIIHTACAINPEERFASAGAMREALLKVSATPKDA